MKTVTENATFSKRSRVKFIENAVFAWMGNDDGSVLDVTVSENGGKWWFFLSALHKAAMKYLHTWMPKARAKLSCYSWDKYCATNICIIAKQLFFLYSMVAFRRSSTSSSVKKRVSLTLLTGSPDRDISKQRVIIQIKNKMAPRGTPWNLAGSFYWQMLMTRQRFRIVLAFSCGLAKRSENAMCGREFFWKRRKKVAFSNENGYVWTGP